MSQPAPIEFSVVADETDEDTEADVDVDIDADVNIADLPQE